MTFLDQQLEGFYLTENFEKGLRQVKSKTPAIMKSLEAGNLFKTRSILNTLPDVSLDELMQASSKARNFNKYYSEAKRFVKGDKSEAQKIFILTYTAFSSIKAALKDKQAISKVDEILIELRAVAESLGTRMIMTGFTLTLLMRYVGFFFVHVPGLGVAVGITMLTGTLIFWVGILYIVVKIVLNTYFSLKGIR